MISAVSTSAVTPYARAVPAVAPVRDVRNDEPRPRDVMAFGALEVIDAEFSEVRQESETARRPTTVFNALSVTSLIVGLAVGIPQWMNGGTWTDQIIAGTAFIGAVVFKILGNDVKRSDPEPDPVHPTVQLEPDGFPRPGSFAHRRS